MEQYQLENGALCRLGSRENYNRVLYGGHNFDDGPGRFFTLAGDTPIFMGVSSDYLKDTWCYQAKNGILMSGLALTPGHVEGGSRDIFSMWFHECGDVVTSWKHGYLEYEITQFSSYFPMVKAKIAILPLIDDEGYLVQYDITTDQRIIWCAGFSGITEFFGRFEYHHSLRRDFSSEDCVNNTAACHNGYASISGPLDVTMLIGDNFGAQYSADSDAAMLEAHPSRFLTSHDGNANIVKLHRTINANEHLQGTVVVLRNSTSERMKELLKPGIPAILRAAIRKKYAAVTFISPDKRLDMTVPDTMIAQDASFHGNSFYHGAIGYHAPFLGWRGWYAPTLMGWHDRVKSAILTHFNTILRSDLPEKVWYDGADRPDLDHEGTQYHHLVNTHGRLTALLHRDDIYDMQEVAIDMTLHYFDHTRDLETAAIIYDRLIEALDWQERIMDPDGDGLYQNFLNTWISDGHCYNGAGCAQGSCYNLRANRRAIALGKALGKDTSRLEARVKRITDALVPRLWLEEKGVLAESVDTIGNKLLHPSPELSTIYLAIECDALTREQALRMLLWTKSTLRQVTTRGTRGGRLYYSSEWLPKKYSTCGLFPAENAALALAMFKVGMADEAITIINGLADAYDLACNPGSLNHILADTGAADAGDIDFTDVSSCYLRLLFEGLWGVHFQRLDNTLTLAPQIPNSWPLATLVLPDVSMTLHHEALCDILEINCNIPGQKIIRLPMRYNGIEQVFLNGEECAFDIQTGFMCGRLQVTTQCNGHLAIRVFYNDTPLPRLQNTNATGFAGERLRINVQNGAVDSIIAPSTVKLLDNGIVKLDDKASGTFSIIIQSGHALLPMTIECPCEKNTGSNSPCGIMEPLDMAPYFNCALTEVHNQKFLSPRPEGYSIGMRINGRYAWEWNHYGHNALKVEDTLLRQANGRFVVPSGVPFSTPPNGANAAVVSIWENFPTEMSIPVTGRARRLHLLLCGTTNAMQSMVTNAVCTAIYKDGTSTSLELIQPMNFDDFLIPSYQKEAECAYISDGTHALHLTINTDPAKELSTIKIQAVANEVILMLLGVTLER